MKSVVIVLEVPNVFLQFFYFFFLSRFSAWATDTAPQTKDISDHTSLLKSLNVYKVLCAALTIAKFNILLCQKMPGVNRE